MTRNRISKDVFSHMVTISSLTVRGRQPRFLTSSRRRGAIESPRCVIEAALTSGCRNRTWAANSARPACAACAAA